jgi:hypothetical protein
VSSPNLSQAEIEEKEKIELNSSKRELQKGKARFVPPTVEDVARLILGKVKDQSVHNQDGSQPFCASSKSWIFRGIAKDV